MPKQNSRNRSKFAPFADKTEWRKKLEEQAQGAATLIRGFAGIVNKTSLVKTLENVFESPDVWKRFSDLTDTRQRQLKEPFESLLHEDGNSFFAECHADWLWASDEYDKTGLTEEPGEYVAVVNRTVLGAGDDDIELRHRVARIADVMVERVVIIHRGI